MAKLQVYKFINPGGGSSSSPVATAAKKQTLALNRIGATTTSIGKIVEDLESVAIQSIKNDALRVKAERRRQRRIQDAASESAQEGGGRSDTSTKPVKGKLGRRLKKGVKKSLSWIDTFLGPVGEFLLRLGTFFVVKELLEWTADKENQEKLATFLDKAFFVFDKIFGWASTLVKTTLDGFSNLFGENSDFGDRLKGIGQVLLGITGLRYLMNPFALIGDLSNLLGGDDDVPYTPDAPDDPDRVRKPTQTNPSGADPDLEGPRGRRTASQIGDAYGDTAAKQYKKILAERGDDAARAFELALDNAGGDVSKAQKAFNRLLSRGAFPKIEPPKPGLLARWWNTATDLGGRGLKLAEGLGKGGLDLLQRGIRRIPALPNPLEIGQKVLDGLSAAGKRIWKGTVDAGMAVGNTAKKWGSNVANFTAKTIDDLGSASKNFFNDQIMKRIKPYIDPLMGFAKSAGDKTMKFITGIPGFDQVTKVLKSKGIENVATAGSKLGKRAAAVLPVIGGIVNLLFAYDRFANGDTVGGLLESISGILDIGGLATAGASSVASMFLDGYLFARDFLPQLSEAEDSFISAIGLGPLKTSLDSMFKKLPNLGEIFGGFMKMMGFSDEKDQKESMMGGSIEAPQELFLGGVVKGISNAVSGIGNAVKNVVSNPIVQTAASFIPGAAPIMAGINAGLGLMSGNPMQMLGAATGMIPGLGSIMSGPLGNIAGNLMSGNFLGAATTGLGMINPAMGQLAGSMFSGGFNPMSMVGGLAEQFGMGGIYKAVTGVMGGDYTSAMGEVAAQIGVDPKVITGVQGTASKMMSKEGMSAEYALQQAMEFVPVPIILEKMVPLPQAVPINIPAPQIVSAGPSSLTQRSQ